MNKLYTLLFLAFTVSCANPNNNGANGYTDNDKIIMHTINLDSEEWALENLDTTAEQKALRTENIERIKEELEKLNSPAPQ